MSIVLFFVLVAKCTFGFILFCCIAFNLLFCCSLLCTNFCCGNANFPLVGVIVYFLSNKC